MRLYQERVAKARSILLFFVCRLRYVITVNAFYIMDSVVIIISTLAVAALVASVYMASKLYSENETYRGNQK